MKILKTKLFGILYYRNTGVKEPLLTEELLYVISLTLMIIFIFMSGFIFSLAWLL